MADAEKREKVIRGLECCSQQRGGPELCEQCPYDNEPFPCTNALIRDALDLLKKQEEGIEPIKSTHEQKKYADKIGIFIPDFWCGACKFNLIEHPKFCPNCGKKVKWEGDSDE